MHKVFSVILLIACATDFAFGERRSEAISKSPHVKLQNERIDSPIRVACVGDSITLGFGIEDRTEHSYPAQLQRLLGPCYQIGNFGLSGSGVLKNAKRTGTNWQRCYAKHVEYDDSIAFQPDVVVINLGINDIVHWDELGAEFVDDYVDLIQTYQSLESHPKIFIWHRLAPLFPGQIHFGNANLDELNTAIARVAKLTGVQTIDLHSPLVDHPEWFPDKLHPTADGAKRIAEVVTHAVATSSKPRLSTSFENATVGSIRELDSSAGRWKAEEGHAAIHAQNAFRGSKSLRLLGGEERVLEFTPKRADKSLRNLSFWAERWTYRKPFSFRVDQLVDGEWSEIYNGDNQIKAGGFLTNVRIADFDASAKQFRFRATTPSNSGVLIDDFSLEEPTPMSLATIRVEQPTLPVLVGKPTNPALRIQIDIDGNSGPPLRVKSVSVNTKGTSHLSDISKIEMFYTGTNPIPRALENADSFAEATKFGRTSDSKQTVVFDGLQELQPGPNYLWLSYTLVPECNIDHVVDAGCVSVVLADGTSISPEVTHPQSALRLGVAVRKRGDDKAHTYRIPGLATTNQGTLIGVYDIRYRNGGDLPGDIDVGMSRSTDGGQTWEPMQTIMDMGDDPRWNYDGIGDPSVLVDRQTNTIWVAALWSHGNRGWSGSEPGTTPEETGQLMLVRSDDDGKTWSQPKNITTQLKRPEWCLLLQGPGKGICMQDGTLVFPAQFQDAVVNKRLPRSTIIFSRDNGQTWSIGTGAFDNTTEAQVVELSPGVLMLNGRYNRDGYRVVMTTSDMGRTWQEHSSSRKALIEPGACMASLIDVDREIGHAESARLLFSNPNSSRARSRMTIKASSDQGETWPEPEQLLLDVGGSAGYSCLTMIDSKTVGILYEGSQAHMTFQRVKLSELYE